MGGETINVPLQPVNHYKKKKKSQKPTLSHRIHLLFPQVAFTCRRARLPPPHLVRVCTPASYRSADVDPLGEAETLGCCRTNNARFDWQGSLTLSRRPQPRACPRELPAPVGSEHGFHSQLHKHRTCSQVDGTGAPMTRHKQRIPDFGRGHPAAPGPAVAAPLTHIATVTHPESAALYWAARTLQLQRENSAAATPCPHHKHGSPSVCLSTETADFRRGEAKPVVEPRRSNRLSNMSSAQRARRWKSRECHRRRSTIARQLFVTQQEGSLAGGAHVEH